MRGRPRLYQDKVAEVVQLHSIGHTVREIQAMTGVDKSTVSRMVRRYVDASRATLTSPAI